MLVPGPAQSSAAAAAAAVDSTRLSMPAGTVLDTETLVLEVVKVVVESHGKSLTTAAATQALGMRPLDAWAAGECCCVELPS